MYGCVVESMWSTYQRGMWMQRKRNIEKHWRGAESSSAHSVCCKQPFDWKWTYACVCNVLVLVILFALQCFIDTVCAFYVNFISFSPSAASLRYSVCICIYRHTISPIYMKLNSCVSCFLSFLLFALCKRKITISCRVFELTNATIHRYAQNTGIIDFRSVKSQFFITDKNESI